VTDTTDPHGIPLNEDGLVSLELTSTDITLTKHFQRTDPSGQDRKGPDVPTEVECPPSSSIRGAWRTYTALHVLGRSFDGRDMFFFALGGLRGSGTDPLRNRPSARKEYRDRFPIMALYGTGIAFDGSAVRPGDLMLPPGVKLEDVVFQRGISRGSPLQRTPEMMQRLNEQSLQDLEMLDDAETRGKPFRQAAKAIDKLLGNAPDRARAKPETAAKIAKIISDLAEKVQWDANTSGLLDEAAVRKAANSYGSVHKRLAIGKGISINTALAGAKMIKAGTTFHHTVTIENVSVDAAGLFFHGLEDWADAGAQLGGWRARGAGAELRGTYKINMRVLDPKRGKWGWKTVAFVSFAPRQPNGLTILGPDGELADETNPVTTMMRLWMERRHLYSTTFPDDLLNPNSLGGESEEDEE